MATGIMRRLRIKVQIISCQYCIRSFPKKPIDAHAGDDIGRTINIVSAKGVRNAVFLPEPLKKARPRRGLKHAHHGRDDAAFLNEIDLSLKDRGRVVVETHDESPHDLQPGSVYAFHIGQQIPVGIVCLAALRETDLIGRLDADKAQGMRERPKRIGKLRIY